MMIDEIIGVGEIAISDHRSSQPTFDEFCQSLRRRTSRRNSFRQSGHRQCSSGRWQPLYESYRTGSPRDGNSTLTVSAHPCEPQCRTFERAIEYAKLGGVIDFTGNEDIDYWETVSDEVRVSKGIKRLLEEGADSDSFTISSDGQGSLPLFDEHGQFLGIGMGQSSSLYKRSAGMHRTREHSFRNCHQSYYSQSGKGIGPAEKGRIAEGFDADLCILRENLQIDTVVAMGRIMVRNGIPIVRGQFE